MLGQSPVIRGCSLSSLLRVELGATMSSMLRVTLGKNLNLSNTQASQLGVEEIKTELGHLFR